MGEQSRAICEWTQDDVLGSGVLSSGVGVVLQAPTGWGKTYVAERRLMEVVCAGRRVVFLAPVKALAEELYKRWMVCPSMGKVGIFTGDYGTEERPYPVAFDDADVLLMTPERLDLCTREWRKHWGWIPKVEIVVADEIHGLDDSRRGGRLEGAISRFARLNPLSTVVAMSATMGNGQELAEWLGGVYLCSTQRPVPLKWEVLRFKKVPDKLSVAAEAVKRCVREGGKSLVFCQSRKRTEDVARALCEAGVLADYHHAGRSRAERARVEGALRNRSLDCVVATATLGVGINLPVRQVVLFDIQRWTGAGYEPLKTNEVWQRAGRAGRRGLDDVGEVVVVAHHRDSLAAELPKGKFEPVRSALRDRRLLGEQVIVEIGCGLATTRKHVRRVVNSSLAKLQGDSTDVDALVDSMVKAGMLRVVTGDDGTERLRTTRLGRIAVRHMVSPETVLKTRQAIKRSGSWGVVDVLVLAVATDDMGARLMADQEDTYLLEDRIVRAGSAIAAGGSDQAQAFLGLSEKEWMSVVRTSLGLQRKCEIGTAAACEELACSDAELEFACEQALRVAQAIEAVCHVVKEDESIEEFERRAAERLSKMARLAAAALRTELWGKSAAMAMIAGVGPVMVRRLIASGHEDLEDVALSSVDDLCAIQGVSVERAQQWIEESSSLIKDAWVTDLMAVRGLTADDADRAMKQVEYVGRRAEELKVEGKLGDEVALVTGGGDLREVIRRAGSWHCSCKRVTGDDCKHLVAVRRWEEGLREGERVQ